VSLFAVIFPHNIAQVENVNVVELVTVIVYGPLGQVPDEHVIPAIVTESLVAKFSGACIVTVTVLALKSVPGADALAIASAGADSACSTKYMLFACAIVVTASNTIALDPPIPSGTV
jgi:hypothetical protein